MCRKKSLKLGFLPFQKIIEEEIKSHEEWCKHNKKNILFLPGDIYGKCLLQKLNLFVCFAYVQICPVWSKSVNGKIKIMHLFAKTD